MNTSRNMKTLLVIFLLLFALLAAYLVYIIDVYGDYWFASPYNTRVTAQKSRVVPGCSRQNRRHARRYGQRGQAHIQS